MTMLPSGFVPSLSRTHWNHVQNQHYANGQKNDRQNGNHFFRGTLSLILVLLRFRFT